MFDRLKMAFNSFVEKITTRTISGKEVDRALNDFVFELVENDIALPVAEMIIDGIRRGLLGMKIGRMEGVKGILRRTLSETLLKIFDECGKLDIIDEARKRRSVGEPFVILFVGPNGHGKTTTIAKIAKLFLTNGLSVVLACSDTFRAGALEQLKEHARRLGARMVGHRYGADPAAVAYDAVLHASSKGINVVLIDTAGRLQTNVNLLDELRKVARVVKPDLVIFVGDALTGNDAYDQALKFNEAVSIDAFILTKVDADVKGGAAISIASAIRKPLVFLGIGPGYDDFIAFDSKWYLEKILGVDYGAS